VARRAGGASYARGIAEALPFADARLAFVSIGCAYHWCETEAFLGEAARALEPRGHLLIYDSFFLGESPRSSTLLDWLTREHWNRLPRTPRSPLPVLGEFFHPCFELVESHFLDAWVPMSRRTLLTYLTTQSGAVAAIESGERSLEEMESFLASGLSDLVPEDDAEFRFGSPLWLLRRVC